MTELELLKLFQRYGPLVGVILFFIWRDWKREEQMTKRITTLEEFQAKVLTELVEKTVVALAQNATYFRFLIRLSRGEKALEDFDGE